MSRTRPHFPPPALTRPGHAGIRPARARPASRLLCRARQFPAAGRWRGGERGSAAVEITLLTPLLVIMLLFVVFLGRVTGAQAAISDAAHQAARAASIAPTPATAAAQAQQAAATALSGRGLACQHFTVTMDLGGFRPGGTVRATVTCTTGLSDLALLDVPGRATLSASFTSVIDTYRSRALGFSNSEGPSGVNPSSGRA
jgi:Flp pilus assembly protein TadG